MNKQLSLFDKIEDNSKLSLKPIDMVIRLLSSEYDYFRKLGAKKFRYYFNNKT